MDLLVVHGGGVDTRLTQHAGRQADVEHAPAEGAAGLVGDDLSELRLALLHQIGGALEDLTPPGKRRLGPVVEGRRGRLDRACARPPGPQRRPTEATLTGVGVAHLERPTSRRLHPLAADQQLAARCSL